METENKVTKAVEKYLDYYRDQTSGETASHAKRTLTDFAIYLQSSNTSFDNISIEQVDQFLAFFNKGYAPGTCRTNRSHVRKFLKYLYQHGDLKKDLGALVVSPPEFGPPKPPKFLYAHEVQKLFDGLDLSTTKDLRTNATLHLAYYLGLRPKEIRLLTLDDISFRQKEVFIRTRKNCDPAHLPIPNNVIKAIAAYMVGGRPETQSRVLFLQLTPPYKPVNKCDIRRDIKESMTKNNLESSTYWLRHSYAQNLLESGASIYEIKEMMGHKSLDATKKYLSIHINLMRKVILDEPI